MRTTLMMFHSLGLLAWTVYLGSFVSCGAKDLEITAFRGTNYGDWKATGTAFTSGPASGALLARLEIENASNEALASSEIEGDGPTGTLTSPPFRIARNYISFRIGGGDCERDTCFNLLINGRIVKSATGWRSDRLAPASWDVSRLRGQKAQLQIVDAASGDWGHITPIRNRPASKDAGRWREEPLTENHYAPTAARTGLP